MIQFTEPLPSLSAMYISSSEPEESTMTRGLVVLPGPLEVVGSEAIIDKFL